MTTLNPLDLENFTSSQTQTADGDDVQTPKFYQLNLNKPILKALKASGYHTPTPIQEQAIPFALQGRDLLLSAQTGSGKTAAFVLPVLDKLSRLPRLEKQVYALILTPTRELACQVHDSIRRYGAKLKGVYSLPVVGGSPYGGQIRALRKGVQIIVATPGRLIDHMNEGRVDLSNLQMLILDEADRMLDMGFADDIKQILEATPQTRQTVMSSATWDGAVGKIAQSFTSDPEKISIKVESGHIEESVYFCDDFHHKNKLLLQVLEQNEIKQAVIFTATKRSTETLAESLVQAGFRARYLHGDLPQGKRNRIVQEMKSGSCDLLIATDVAARGIDISQISHVINYDLPRQVEDYVHRIGRCGRAGRTGVAINLCSFDDYRQLQQINQYLKREMSEAQIEGLEPKRSFKRMEKSKKSRQNASHSRRHASRGARTDKAYQPRPSSNAQFDGENEAFAPKFRKTAERFERKPKRPEQPKRARQDAPAAQMRTPPKRETFAEQRQEQEFSGCAKRRAPKNKGLYTSEKRHSDKADFGKPRNTKRKKSDSMIEEVFFARKSPKAERQNQYK